MNDFATFSNFQALLDDEAIGEDSLNFIETHGYITASIISPRQTNAAQLLKEIVGDGLGALNQTLRISLQNEINSLCKFIERQMLTDEALELPLYLDLDDEHGLEDLEAWCYGFMEKHLSEEEAWFEQGGEEIAQMLLPIVVASGVIEDEEIDKIREDQELFANMIDDLPELLVDLFMHFHGKDAD